MRLKKEHVMCLKHPVYTYKLLGVREETRGFPGRLLTIATINCQFSWVKKRWFSKRKDEYEESFYFELVEDQKKEFTIGFNWARIAYQNHTKKQIQMYNEAVNVFRDFLIEQSPYRNQLVLQAKPVTVYYLP